MNLHRMSGWAGCSIMAALIMASVTRPGPASASIANPSVTLDSALYVEKTRMDNSRPTRSLEQARHFAPGDRVVTVVTWYRLGGNGGFTVTNPLPRSLSYQGSASDDEEVSIDGGRNWGRLGDLRIGARQATPQDITHVRWHIPANRAAAGQGRITYSGIIR